MKFIIVLLTCASNLCLGQTIDTIKNNFIKYREDNFMEKLFVHLDRTVYLTGESMWFKVYYVNGVSNKPENLSKTAYIEILDNTNQRVLEGKIALRDAHGNGTFFIPATLTTGNYMLRAYTAWMKNGEQDFFFHQPITIINGFKAAQLQPLPQSKTKVDAQFMPEGGQLVANVSSRVGFRVADEKGRGISFRGTIINHTSDSIVHFLPDTFGIGSFDFVPLPGVHYKALIRTPDGEYLFPLPEVLEEGYTLRINDVDEKLEVKVTSTVTSRSSPFVYLFIHTRNQIVVTETKFLTKDEAVFVVSKAKLGDGVSHITLFDGDLKPVCERLYYKKPGNIVAIRASTDAEVYSPRSRVKLLLDIADVSSPAVANLNLSLSVYMADSLRGFHQKNIGEYLMLSSDLLRHIESPAFYLFHANEKQLDHLMLTHGWRKFVWKEVLRKDKRTFDYLPELHGPIIKSGLVNEAGKPVPNVRTFLSAPSKIVQLHTSVSRTNGDLHYIASDIFGKQRIIFQHNAKDSVYRFTIKSPFIDAKQLNLPEFDLIPGPQSILKRHIALQVQDIFYPEKSGSALGADSASFFGKADETYYLDDYTRFPVMEEVMREYVKGVWVRKRNNEFYFKVLDNINKSVFEDEPLVMLDGVPIFKTDKIMSFDPKKVQRIDVMTRVVYVGRNAFSGIVSFSTYTGDLAGFEIDRNSVALDYDGLQAQRTFYTPKYTSDTSRNSRLPDQRTLLHWNPDISTANGKIEIEFYTSDLIGEFEVQVQGINDDGKMGSGFARFRVNHDNE